MLKSNLRLNLELRWYWIKRAFRPSYKHDSAGGLLLNAQGLIASTMLHHARQLPDDSVRRLYGIWQEMKALRYTNAD